jgi:hypothetical protein
MSQLYRTAANKKMSLPILNRQLAPRVILIHQLIRKDWFGLHPAALRILPEFLSSASRQVYASYLSDRDIQIPSYYIVF